MTGGEPREVSGEIGPFVIPPLTESGQMGEMPQGIIPYGVGREHGRKDLGREADGLMRDVIDEIQRRAAQRTGKVPFLSFITGPDGALHELVEEEAPKVEDQGEQ